MIKHVCFLDNLMKCVDAVLWRDSRAGSSQACVTTVRRDKLWAQRRRRQDSISLPSGQMVSSTTGDILSIYPPHE